MPLSICEVEHAICAVTATVAPRQSNMRQSKRAPVRRTKKEPTLEQSNRVIDHDPWDHHYLKDEGSFFLIILETVIGAIGTFEPKGIMYTTR